VNDRVVESEAKVTPASQEVLDQPTEKALTFAEIKHLIETGQTHLIPHNKTIPDKINVR
jgi:hypothetical protein